MTQKKLNKIFEDHLHWLNKDCDGWNKKRANLSGVDLSFAYLCDVNLTGANLTGANLSGAQLCGANLSDTNLTGAHLICTNFSDANLSGANLSYANLSYACLRDVDLNDAILNGAILNNVDLNGAKSVPYIPYSCPNFGAFIGFKKAGNKIVVLEIPEDAKRLSSTGRKCRCNKAKVLRIENVDGTDSGLNEICSNYDEQFIYKVGEAVSV